MNKETLERLLIDSEFVISNMKCLIQKDFKIGSTYDIAIIFVKNSIMSLEEIKKVLEMYEKR